VLGLGVVAAAFLSAPTFAVWCLAFLNAKPAWRKDDDAAEAGMENDMNVSKSSGGVGLTRRNSCTEGLTYLEGGLGAVAVVVDVEVGRPPVDVVLGAL